MEGKAQRPLGPAERGAGFVKEGSTSDGNHDEAVRAVVGGHSPPGDTEQEGQDWAHAGGSRGDKMLMNSSRSCHRAAAPWEPSRCPQVGRTVPAVTGPGPCRAPAPHCPLSLHREFSEAVPGRDTGARRGVGSVPRAEGSLSRAPASTARRGAELSPRVAAGRSPGREGQRSRRTRGPQRR